MAEKLRRDRSENMFYYTVMGQDFIRKSSEDNKDAVKRVNKEGVDVWEIHAEDLSGVIASVKLVDNQRLNRKELHVLLQDADEKMLIQLPHNYRQAISLMLSLPNMRHGEFYTLKPFHFHAKDTGKLQSGINAYDHRGIHKDYKVPRLDTKELTWFPKVDEEEKELMGADYWAPYFSKTAVYVYKNLLPGIIAEFNREAEAGPEPQYAGAENGSTAMPRREPATGDFPGANDEPLGLSDNTGDDLPF